MSSSSGAVPTAWADKKHTHVPAAVPEGITVSTLLPSHPLADAVKAQEAAAKAAAQRWSQDGYTKHKQHRGVKVRLGSAFVSPSELRRDVAAARADGEDEGDYYEEQHVYSPPAEGGGGAAGAPGRRSLPDYKLAVRRIIDDYLAAGALDAALTEIHGLGQSEFNHELVRRALIAGIERGDEQREHISRLLSNIYGVDVPMHEIGLSPYLCWGVVEEFSGWLID